jgi:hypothetical protein
VYIHLFFYPFNAGYPSYVAHFWVSKDSITTAIIMLKFDKICCSEVGTVIRRCHGEPDNLGSNLGRKEGLSFSDANLAVMRYLYKVLANNASKRQLHILTLLSRKLG